MTVTTKNIIGKTSKYYSPYTIYNIVEITQVFTERVRVRKYIDGLPYYDFERKTSEYTFYSIEEENGSWIRQFETEKELREYLSPKSWA